MELYYAEDRCNVAKELGASIRDLYVSLIKNGALSPDDAMLTAYLLWGSDEERTYMTVTMLRRHGQKRFEAHNFATAAKKEGSFEMNDFSRPAGTTSWVSPTRCYPTMQRLAETEVEGGGPIPPTKVYRLPKLQAVSETSPSGGAYFAQS
eukprot:PhM_4_TR8419/c3_g1_i3/m.8241